MTFKQPVGRVRATSRTGRRTPFLQITQILRSTLAVVALPTEAARDGIPSPQKALGTSSIPRHEAIAARATVAMQRHPPVELDTPFLGLHAIRTRVSPRRVSWFGRIRRRMSPAKLALDAKVAEELARRRRF